MNNATKKSENPEDFEIKEVLDSSYQNQHANTDQQKKGQAKKRLTHEIGYLKTYLKKATLESLTKDARIESAQLQSKINRTLGNELSTESDYLSAIGQIQQFYKTHPYIGEGVKVVKNNPNYEEISYVDKTPKLLSAAQIQALPKPKPIIAELQIVKDDITCIFGASGSGKSYLSTDLACSLAQTGTVIYIAAEAVGTFSVRLTAWQQFHKLSLDNLFFWPDAIDLLDKTSIGAFLNEIQQLEPVMVVVDTLARCMPGADENSAKDMGLAVGNLDIIRRATSAAILVVHHTGKNGGDERGSTALRGACSTMIKLQNDDGLITLRCEKSRTSAGFDECQFRLIGVGDDTILIKSSKVDMTNSPLTKTLASALRAITEWPHALGVRITDLATATGSNPGTASRQLSNLKKRELIEEDSGYFRVTAKGQSVLTAMESDTQFEQNTTSIHTTLNWRIPIK